MQRTRRWSSKWIYLAGLALTVSFFAGPAPCAQQSASDEGFLVVALLKTQILKDQVAADVRAIEADLETNEGILKEAERKLAIAIETRNRQASIIPAVDLRNARSERIKLKRTKSRLEHARARVEATYALVKSALLLVPRPDPAPRKLGLVSPSEGTAVVRNKNGAKTSIDGKKPVFLVLGDDVSTGDSGRSDVDLLNGRGAIRLGGRSRLKLEEDSARTQAIRLVEGKAYIAVDRPQDIERMLRSGIEIAGDDLGPILARYRGLTDAEILALYGRDLELRILPAVCSAGAARFSVEIKNGKAVEIKVFEGSIEVGDPRGGKPILVEEGFAVSVTKDVVSEPQPLGDVDKWWEK